MNKVTFPLESKLLTAYQSLSSAASALGEKKKRSKRRNPEVRVNAVPLLGLIRRGKKKMKHPLSNKRSRFGRRLQLRLSPWLHKKCSQIVKMLNGTLTEYITVWHHLVSAVLTGRPLSPIPGNPGSPFSPGFPRRATVLPMSAGSTGHTSHGSPWGLNTRSASPQCVSYADVQFKGLWTIFMGTFSPLDPGVPLGPYWRQHNPSQNADASAQTLNMGFMGMSCMCY